MMRSAAARATEGAGVHRERRRRMQVTWSKCTGDVWCNLLTLNLRHERFRGVQGVFII